MNYLLLVLAAVMLYGIRLMSSPKTAVRGQCPWRSALCWARSR